VFETNVTIVGNVLSDPVVRRIMNDQTTVTNFKVASTARRFDRLTNGWVDGVHLRVRVNCWRRLADNVRQCVQQGDPVVVTGRLYSRDWIGEDKVHRVTYELDAVAVGHDLSRGIDRFTRHRASRAVSATEDAESASRVGGELTEPVDEPPVGPYDEALENLITSVEQEDPFVFDADRPVEEDSPDESSSSEDSPEDSPSEDSPEEEPSRRRRRRTPVGV
jgi:single-strand DNA-binding protein